jgi:hypothetical protein
VFGRKVFVLVLLVVIGISFWLVGSQKGFAPSTFELGKQTEVSGILSLEPVPMLSLDQGQESILLIGYGKFGAEGALREALATAGLGGQDFYRATLKGTLIYYDGKALLELTERAGSVRSIEVAEQTGPNSAELSPIALRGEIIDPKCYFGAMKPGEGKPHRSCAIRCISGGIPPVLKVENEEGAANYFILRGQRGQAVNAMVLDFVGEPVEVSGMARQFHNWMVLDLDESAGILPWQRSAGE